MSYNTIGSFIGLGRETTYGTPVASSAFLEFLDESIKFKTGRVVKPTLRSATPLRSTKMKKAVDGSFKIPFPYGGAELILKDLLGAVDTTDNDPVYEHVFTPATALPVGLTMRVGMGEFTDERIYSGIKIPKATFSISPEGQLECSVDVLGADETTGSKSSPTYPTQPFVQWDELTVSTIGGAAVNLQTMEITIENALDGDTHKLGSLTRQQPGRSGHRKVTGKFEFEFASMTHYNYVRNLTQNAIVITFEGATISGADKYTLTFSIPKVIWGGETPSMDKVGPIKQVLMFEAEGTATNNEIEITLKNTTSAVA